MLEGRALQTFHYYYTAGFNAFHMACCPCVPALSSDMHFGGADEAGWR